MPKKFISNFVLSGPGAAASSSAATASVGSPPPPSRSARGSDRSVFVDRGSVPPLGAVDGTAGGVVESGGFGDGCGGVPGGFVLGGGTSWSRATGAVRVVTPGDSEN